jgi:hypothetical protein
MHLKSPLGTIIALTALNGLTIANPVRGPDPNVKTICNTMTFSFGGFVAPYCSYSTTTRPPDPVTPPPVTVHPTITSVAVVTAAVTVTQPPPKDKPSPTNQSWTSAATVQSLH